MKNFIPTLKTVGVLDGIYRPVFLNFSE